jgi:hypothetical protein
MAVDLPTKLAEYYKFPYKTKQSVSIYKMSVFGLLKRGFVKKAYILHLKSINLLFLYWMC